jgi:hypothetical protein
VTHELGHALGLGGSADPTSPMYETLAAGAVQRTPTVADLNISDPPADADPERAAPPVDSGETDWVNRLEVSLIRRSPRVFRSYADADALAAARYDGVDVEVFLKVAAVVADHHAAGGDGWGHLNHVRGALIRGCMPRPGTKAFLKVTGKDSSVISLLANDFSGVMRPVEVAEGAGRQSVVEVGNRR